MSRPRSASGAVEVVWPGKYGPDGARVEVPARALGLQVEQVIGGAEAEPTRAPGLLLGGDNLLVMDALMPTHAGAIDLVYIDPPFATGHEFERTTRVGADAEGPELRSRAYSDRWPGGVAGLLQMLDPRLRRIHRLLAPHGSLYVHVDPIVGHAVKLLLDEIFGPGCFQREIVWRVGWVSGFKARANNWIRNHDLIYFYVKDPQRFVFHRQVNPHPAEYRRRKGEADQQGGVPVEDVWNASPAEWRLRGPDSLDSIQIKSFSREKTGWATQKNESLLRRIVAASSNPGGLVADFFCGAGTTLAAAHALGRRWIGCDSAAAAVELAHARMAEKPGVQFVRAGLGAEERQIWLSGQVEPWPAAALRLRGAEAVAGPLAGVAGETAVWVGPLAAAVTAAEVAEAAAAAASLGLRRLEVLGWAWAFPAGAELAPGTGVSVVCLQLRRSLLDPRCHAGDPPWSERPVVEVRFALEATETGFRARAMLMGARFSAPTRATAALETTGDRRAAIEAWSLAFTPSREAGQAGGSRTFSENEARIGEEAPRGASETEWPAESRGVEASRGASEAKTRDRDSRVEARSPVFETSGATVRVHESPTVVESRTDEEASRRASQAERAAEARGVMSPSREASEAARVVETSQEAGEAERAAPESTEMLSVPFGGDSMFPHHPVFAAARTRNRRELDVDSGWLELPGTGPWTAWIRVVDVLGGETWHAWRIEHVR
ncbi:DNA methyltransferase [Nannocystis punicea]|uniref:site-specific DNA-methyltransferase (adenine-specific) n=1 Tax=Nannocystis punicea TaxID=2995304 RepID=A0ABY7HAG7_9BACT|nr:DNA methyltransferase [Nannocystis poenicansa]WAS96211.1 DNA methyltransferase [Nannocystis poenicansa]